MDLAYVCNVNDRYKNRLVTLYRLKTGETERVKVKGQVFEKNPIEEGQVIKTIEASRQKKWRRLPDGKFKQIDEYETILQKWSEIT